MKKIILSCYMLSLGLGIATAQPKKIDSLPTIKGEKSEARESGREYSIIVYERQSNSPLSFDREISNGRSGGFFGTIYDVYRSTFAGKIINLSTNVLGTGYDLIVKALNKKKGKSCQLEKSHRKRNDIYKKVTYAD